MNKIEFYTVIATCGAWVTNFSFPLVPKSKDQLFIQTWHGDRAFKKILFDANSENGKRVLAEAIDGFCDLALAGSDYGEMQYRSGFKYNGKILRVGTPRDDILLHPVQKRMYAIKASLGLDVSTKIMIYAPTLRWKNHESHTAQQIQDIDLYKTLEILENKYGGKWKCLLRAHPGVVNLSGVIVSEKIMDVSGYDDMTDLLLISDFLITDYSSCAGDFALLNRPIVLYQSDRAEYLEKDRAFYFNIEESPYFVAENQDEIGSIIEGLTDEKVRMNCQEILDFYHTTETGNASREIASVIMKRITE